MYTVTDIIDNPILRDEAVMVITGRAIMLADRTGYDDDNRFPTIAEGMIHDAACHFVENLDSELERDDERGILAERAYDLIWNPCANRVWQEARNRASERVA